jgi:hypothetical protein
MVTVVIADCASMDTDCFSDNIRCIRKVHGACPYSDSRAPLRTIVAAGDPLTLTHRQRYAYSETVDLLLRRSHHRAGSFNYDAASDVGCYGDELIGCLR